MKKTFLNTVIGTLFLLQFQNCKKNENKESATKPSTNISSIAESSARSHGAITIENSYLHFTSYDNLCNTVADLNALSETGKDNWETSLGSGFTSMRKIFNSDMVADTNYFYNLAVHNIDSVIPADSMHCAQLNNNLKMYVRYDLQPSDGGGYYLLKNIIEDDLSAVVNSDGIVRMGDMLYQIKKDTVKCLYPITSDGQSKLMAATTSNSANGITISIGIWPIYGARTEPYTPPCGSPASFWNPNAWAVQARHTFSKHGKLAIDLQVGFKYEQLPDCANEYRPSLAASVNSLRRNFWGSWVFDFSPTMTVSFNFTQSWQDGIDPVLSDFNGATFSSGGPAATHNHKLFFNLINTYSTGSMFTLSNVTVYATRSGGPSGGSVSVFH